LPVGGFCYFTRLSQRPPASKGAFLPGESCDAKAYVPEAECRNFKAMIGVSGARPLFETCTNFFHPATEAGTKEGAQGRTIGIADLCGDGLDIVAFTLKKRLSVFDAQILEVGEWGFAEHGVATALQGAGAGGDGLGSVL